MKPFIDVPMNLPTSRETSVEPKDCHAVMVESFYRELIVLLDTPVMWLGIDLNVMGICTLFDYNIRQN